MVIYFYHTRPIEKAYQEWEHLKHPGHILYGITEFKNHEITPIFHNYLNTSNRIKLAIYNAIKILFSKKDYSILYGTHSLGLEIIIMLRALGIYNKPIVIWQHRKTHSSNNLFLNYLHSLFYKGVDKLFFFTPLHVNESIKTGNVGQHKCKVIKWGPDLEFYDNIMNQSPTINKRFISTGKENRDFSTLINAFSNTNIPVDIFTTKINGKKNYIKEIFLLSDFTNNISLNVVSGIIPYELSIKVASAFAVVICCTDENYTVGLTTLVEALALGKPILVTANPYHIIDVEKFKCGIKINAEDIDGWKKAIEYLSRNAEEAEIMGQNARALAENEFNLKDYAEDICRTFKSLLN